ncbi:MAG: hypothetical protein IJR88_05315 [Clostridia bacterium]|nr:hypothetical protein [Clostridia bacterium]
MKILYFDMEFANGQVPGSIYSMGYLMTDEDFHILVPQTDLLINPDCAWNEYVEHKILAYPKETVEASPTFPDAYEKIRALFDEVEIAVGFAAGNDTRELRRDCDRYGLPKIQFPYLDLEPLCKSDNLHRGAHGLAGYVKAYCGFDPENQHRSDGDAYATMCLFQALCQSKHATPDMMVAAYPECCGEAIPVQREKKKRTSPKSFHRRRRRPRTGKNKNPA